MSHPDVGPGTQGSETEEAPGGAHMMQGRPGAPELGMQPGNGGQQMMVNQASTAHMMKQGPLPSSMPQHPGASPQQQLPSQAPQGGPMPGIHFPNVPTTSQSSRPKTPNRASPRPYHHPLTPTNRPPSTEPSEINLSPERLNASIAGLFPPKINIPLPPRQPNLNRGFDQQGLNPTTLKAIGQAPPNLNLQGSSNNGSGNNGNNGQQSFSSVSGAAGPGGKQDKQSGGQGKRASPSNSRRSSPASSRKAATPSPGRQKGTKMALPPNQQQLINPQGQTMMLNHPSVAPNLVSMPSPVAAGTEVQHAQNTFVGMQGNPAEGPKEGQGNMPQPQSMSHTQPPRELSAPRMATPRVPMPHESGGLEPQAGSVERQPVNTTTPTPDSVSETLPASRDAPMSLNQLLDNQNAAGMPLRPTQSAPARDVGKETPRPPSAPERQQPSGTQSSDIPGAVVPTPGQVETEAKPKSASAIPTSSPSLQTTASTNLNNTNPTAVPGLNHNPTLSQAVRPTQSVIATTTHGSALIQNTNVTLAVAPHSASSSHSSPLSAVCSSFTTSSIRLQTEP